MSDENRVHIEPAGLGAEVEKTNSSSVAESADQPCGLTETQRSAGLAAAIAELDRMLSEGLKGRTHDVWQRAYNAGVRDARRVLNAALVASPKPDGLCAERAAFRAGWYVNAAADDQPAEYLAGCEDADWRGYLRGALCPAEMSASSPAEGRAGNLPPDEPLQSQARRVEELEGALGQISRMRFFPDHAINQTTLMAAIKIARSVLSEGERGS